MFFVGARYHRDPSRVGAQVHYISHREEGLVGGQRRELFGIGERYRALRGDESAIRRALRDDSRGLRSPVFSRFILTVDNKTAERFSRLEGSVSERVLRDAIDKTFRGTVRCAQGVFSVHQHGGFDRPAHPHVHALLSPRFENGMAVHISPNFGGDRPWTLGNLALAYQAKGATRESEAALAELRTLDATAVAAIDRDLAEQKRPPSERSK